MRKGSKHTKLGRPPTVDFRHMSAEQKREYRRVIKKRYNDTLMLCPTCGYKTLRKPDLDPAQASSDVQDLLASISGIPAEAYAVNEHPYFPQPQ